jgi:hypothetical protein
MRKDLSDRSSAHFPAAVFQTAAFIEFSSKTAEFGFVSRQSLGTIAVTYRKCGDATIARIPRREVVLSA